MTRIEDQLRQLGAAPALRPALPMENLERRSSQITRRRRRTLTAIVVLIAIAVFLVPLPQLLHSAPPRPAGHGKGPSEHSVAKQLAVLKASDAVADGCFGSAVAVSGNTAVMGAPCHGTGRAYVFTKTAGGWRQVAELKGSDTLGGCFGSAVAVSSSTLVVNDACYSGDAGRLYVFTREATGWRLTAQLEGSDTAGNDKFGYAVAISGDTLVAGAFQHEAYAGRAYVFQKTAGGWTQTAELHDPDNLIGDSFGWSVGISGSTVVVGASGSASDAPTWDGGAGQAYVFAKTADGWKQTAELKGSDTAATDAFGSSVAISGATVVVGAQDASRTGRAYVFTKTAKGWTQVAELKGSSGAGLFGYSAGVSGDTILVSAPVVAEEVSFPSRAPGQAYVYTKTAAGWTEVAELEGSGAVRGDSFGYWVAISGATALVGEPDAPHVGGRAFLFHV
jgi:FG-GAP repeat